MTRRELVCSVLLPVLSVPAYFFALVALRGPLEQWFLSETGPIELATAAFFLAAALGAVAHLRRNRASLPRAVRVLFGLFAAAALFVALEEVSYGQHLLGFECPRWFERHNHQGELNLHNMLGNRPSRRLRVLGSAAIPFVCIVLPFLHRRHPQAWRHAHWTWYLVPKWELVGLVVLAQLVTVPGRLPESLVGETRRLGELKEFYWSLAAWQYIRLMSQRVERARAAAAESSAAELLPLRAATSPGPRLAA
ncbi:MAG: hypothetical protein KY476_01395 [Planctomycetes bacterium]|nr:hypothetical protein [Planctomycetota bacterium]